MGELPAHLAEPDARGAGGRGRRVLAARGAGLRAAGGIARGQLGERSFVRGGSTITQQLAKNLYLSPSKNPLRKFKELIIARRLEAELTRRGSSSCTSTSSSGATASTARKPRRGHISAAARAASGRRNRRCSRARSSTRACSIPRVPTRGCVRRQGIILRRMGSVTPPPAAATVPAPPRPATPASEEPVDEQPRQLPQSNRCRRAARAGRTRRSESVTPPTAEPTEVQ